MRCERVRAAERKRNVWHEGGRLFPCSKMALCDPGRCPRADVISLHLLKEPRVRVSGRKTLVCIPHFTAWLNRISSSESPLRYFFPDGERRKGNGGVRTSRAHAHSVTCLFNLQSSSGLGMVSRYADIVQFPSVGLCQPCLLEVGPNRPLVPGPFCRSRSRT